jgi:hypothetical protein
VKPRFTARLSRRLTFFSLAVMAFGLLLWARLILVTGRPRMAIADPDRQHQIDPAKAPTPSGQSPPDASHPAPASTESAEPVADRLYFP